MTLPIISPADLLDLQAELEEGFLTGPSPSSLPPLATSAALLPDKTLQTPSEILGDLLNTYQGDLFSEYQLIACKDWLEFVRQWLSSPPDLKDFSTYALVLELHRRFTIENKAPSAPYVVTASFMVSSDVPSPEPSAASSHPETPASSPATVLPLKCNFCDNLGHSRNECPHLAVPPVAAPLMIEVPDCQHVRHTGRMGQVTCKKCGLDLSKTPSPSNFGF